jgi:hypothetical protein
VYEELLISAWSDLLPDVVGRNRWCCWKERSVLVSNCKSILVTETNRNYVRRHARFKQHQDASSHKFFPCKARRPRKFTPFSHKLHENMHHRMPQRKSECPRLNVVIFPPILLLVLVVPKRWPPRNLLILEDRRISTKSIGEQLGISRERVGSIIHEDLDMRKLSAKRVPKYLKAEQNRQRRPSSEQYLEFFSAIQMTFCREWWPWTKPGYITTTWRQSNNQWSGGIEAHPAPKIPSSKIHWKSSRLDFLG